jgi:predicted NBD/HSP70 family sugar kinase
MSIELNHNQKTVLNVFRWWEETSKAEVVRLIGLSHPAVTHIVEKLISFGYLEKVNKKRRGDRGQPASLYQLSNRTLFVGIHLGRNKLEFVALGLDGRVHASKRILVGFFQKDKLESISRSELNQFLTSSDIDKNLIAGFGISTPFFWEGWQDKVSFPNLTDPNWNSNIVIDLFDLPNDLPVFVENDGSAAALGELTFGAGKELTDFVYINIGTFVGGGVVIDGTLRTGVNGNTGAIGTFPVSHSELSGNKSDNRPFESVLGRASLNTLFELAKKNNSDLSPENYEERLSNDPPDFALEWIEDSSKALAQLFIGIWSLIDVEALILDGALPKNVLIELIDITRKEVDSLAIEGIFVSQILPGKLGSWRSAIGAGSLPILRLLGPRVKIPNFE